jgi:hypothetical protein
MVYETLCWIDHTSPLIVNFVVSCPPSLQRERGGVGKIHLLYSMGRSLLLIEHLGICLLIFKTGFLCNKLHKYGDWRRVREGVRADLMSLTADFNPTPLLALTPL